MVTRCSKPGKSQRKCMATPVVMRVLTRSSYGSALHYDLSMFGKFEKLPISFSNLNFSQILQAFPFASLEFIK